MPFSLNDLVWGLVAPLLLAAILRWGLAALTDRCTRQPTEAVPGPPSRRILAWETSLPYLAAVAVGYFVLKLGAFSPQAHYEWLPASVGLAAMAACLADLVFGPVWLRVSVRLLLYAATVVLAGYLLMPTWEDLALPYPIFLGVWIATGGIVALAIDFSTVPQRPDQGGTWPWMVVVLGTCLAAAAVVALSESLRFAQVAGLAFSATLGVAIGGILRREAWLPSLGLPLVVHLAGILLIAQTNSYSDVPWWSYVLPMAGLLLAVAGGQAASGKRAVVTQACIMICMAAIPATIAVILAVLAGQAAL